jgi:hypothetical protein
MGSDFESFELIVREYIEGNFHEKSVCLFNSLFSR